MKVDLVIADLSTEEGIAAAERVIRESAHLELLVNNAGFGTMGRFWEASIESQQRMHEVHIIATMRLTHAALAAMVPRGRGGVISVSSVAAFGQSPGNVSYCATKAWINSFTEGLDMELRGLGSPVKVQALCPGFTRTEFHQTLGMDTGKIPAWLWMNADDVVATSLCRVRSRRSHRGAGVAIQDRRGAAETCAAFTETARRTTGRRSRLIVECVPNFSEGRDPVIVSAIAQAVSSAGALLLDTTSDQDHNRSVLTFAGAPPKVADAAVAAVRAAVEKIDLRRHAGVHPRIGVADVIPFVPVHNTNLHQCKTLAHAVGRRIWDELRVPVYFYEAAALRPECQRLENVRKLAPTGLVPDLGEGRHPSAGASVVGARKFLVAWNINLRTSNTAAARAIARAIRESSGGLPAVKSIGLPLESRGQSQVSINLVDFEHTPLYVVFDAVKQLCDDRKIEIAGSELIGMIPAAALEASRGHDLHWENLRPELILENRLRAAGLLQSARFD